MLDRKLIIKLVRFQEQEITEKKTEQKNRNGINFSQLYIKLFKFDKHAFQHTKGLTQQKCKDTIRKGNATYDYNEFENFCLQFMGLHESDQSTVVQDKNNKTKHPVKRELIGGVKDNLKTISAVQIKEEIMDDDDDDEEEDTWSYSSDRFIKCEEIHIKPDEDGLKRHFSNARASKFCPYCQKKYKRKYQLTRHIKVAHEPEKVNWLNCDECTYKTYRSDLLKSHSRVHKSLSELNLFKCPKCKKKFKSKSSLNRHKQRAHMEGNIKWLKCSQCLYQCITNDALKSHMMVHKDAAEIVWHTCDICFQKLKHKGGLTMHRKICSSPNQVVFSCHKCEFKTLHKSSLSVHLQLHKNPSEIPLFQCLNCENKYTVKSTLKRHLKVVHGKPGEAKVHKCPKCPFQTFYKNVMPDHYKKHQNANEIYMYKCEKCSYQSKVRRTLISHSKIHMPWEETKPFKCSRENCFFRTHSNYVLGVHLKTHEKNNSKMLWKFCNVCPYKNRNVRALEEHKKTHKENLKRKIK